LNLAQFSRSATINPTASGIGDLGSGVDVIITIFCDFCQFSAKKIGVFPKYHCYDPIFKKITFVVSQKRQFFSQNFSAKISKNRNIGPRFLPKPSLHKQRKTDHS
jgi:hypothetical protein